MKKLRKTLSAVVLSSLLLLAACGGGGNNATSGNTSTGNSGGSGGAQTMFLGMVNPPILFNPINSSDVASQFAEKFMFDSFLEMESPLKFAPKLADSFETTDNQTYTVKLNKNAKWSDGKPVTADDALFTFQLIVNPKVETTLGSYVSMFEGVENTGKLKDGQSLTSVTVVDDKTFTFKTKAPVDPNMLKEQLGTKLMILPKHALEQIDPATLSQNPFMQKPTVTNGPFKFVQYKKDQFIEFEKNADYYLGAPQLDKLFIKVLPAPNLVAQLQTGEVHMNVALGIGKIPPQDYETVKKLENVRTKDEPTIGFQTLMFNTTKITDPRVRQAIAYALDRQQIVDKLLKGYGEVVDGPYTSVSPYLDKSLEKYSYNTEKAKQLLTEAGWDFNREIDFVVPIGNKVREQSADILTQSLQAVGIKAKVSTFDFPTVMQKAKKGDFEMMLMGLTFTLDPEVSQLYSTTGTFNFMKYSNSTVDELLLKGKAEPNSDKRKEIYHSLQKIWNQDVPIISLYSDNDFSAISKKVTHGEPQVFGFHHQLEKWSVGGAQ
ncbi:ABC transporter substrate-binding protein [Brevibacillus sp. 179-C9.3 HS]|uniref:ABC transporter substrate-binding protein n=1 Tax=unclassified Brevibacillus TaxID=2684853 RepID=UPI0039A1A562